MTQADKRRFLFQSQGWEYIEPKPEPRERRYLVLPENLPRWRKGKRYVYVDSIPDYFNDLNAMHEAEKVLTNNQRGDYSIKLQTITGGEWFLCYHATAAQRAEALGRTLNLWTE